MNKITEQLFTTAFNAGVRYAEEPDPKRRLPRFVEDREAFERIAFVLLPSALRGTDLAPEPEGARDGQ